MHMNVLINAAAQTQRVVAIQMVHSGMSFDLIEHALGVASDAQPVMRLEGCSRLRTCWCLGFCFGR